MSIEIDQNKCIKCGKCIGICPGNLIYENRDGKAYIKYPKDCWGCTACIKECKSSAISYVLSPQIGGSGGKMSVLDDGLCLIWTVKKHDGETINITVDKRESNRY